MVKFSVTIPAYKKRFLAEAIESVLAQSYRDFELVIVNDCSPEDLEPIVRRYSDTRIHYYSNETNHGAVSVVDNWNICLNHCAGDYVICMGDDDRMLPYCLDEYAKLIEKYPHLNVYHAWTRIIDESGEVTSVLEPRPERESVFALVYYRWTGRRQYIGDFCYRTQHLRDNGGYFKLPLAWGSDDITAVRAASTNGIANTGSICFEYRISNLTISSGTDFTEVKLKASLLEKRWYDDWLSRTVSKEVLSEQDRWFLMRLRTIEDGTFRRRMVEEVLNEVGYNKLRFFYWLFRLRKYEIPTKFFIKSMFRRAFLSSHSR